jgi:cytochrome d ubiquinol oxidase subunit II
MIIPTDNWFNLFSVFSGASLVFGYALLGATRMIIKTEAVLQERLYIIARCALFCVWICLVVISLWTPFIDDFTKQKWFYSGHLALLAILPTITTLAFISCVLSLFSKKEHLPYWSAIVVFACTYCGFGYSIWPYIVPHSVTVWQAASAHSSLAFMMVGACIMIPVLLYYTWYSYHIFRGKVKDVLEY